MTDQHDFTQLENALIEVGRSIEYPATPPLAARVRAQLSTDRSRPPVRSIFGSRRFAIGLAAIALVLIALLIIPQTRDVIAQILGLKTIRVIEVAPTATAIAATPAPTPTPGVVPFKQC
ncbi:MAG TPA: hypothetical protein VFF59_12825, partial [Anaerolineae bacterium]|nr:hypothetical protein [Anaerolineae bacterium]